MYNSVSLRACSLGGNVFKGVSVIFDVAAARTELKSIYTYSLTNDLSGEEMVVVEVGKPSTAFSSLSGRVGIFSVQ